MKPKKKRQNKAPRRYIKHLPATYKSAVVVMCYCAKGRGVGGGGVVVLTREWDSVSF